MALDNRIVELTIETDGQTKTFRDVSIHARGTKFANGIQNEVNIDVANLNRDDREFILTEVSPYNLDRSEKKVILRAGRESTGISTIFIGDIFLADVSQPPDITLKLRAKTSNFYRTVVKSNSFNDLTPLSVIAQQVADDMALTLRFEATDKNISNFTYTGSALKQVDYLGEMGGVQAYIDDTTLIVKDYNVALQNSLRILSKDTGMLEKPSLDIQGIKVKYLLDRFATLGGAIQTISEVYPASDGIYNIYKLDFDVANRKVPFYWLADAKRQNTR